MLDCVETGYAASVSSVDIFFPHPKRQVYRVDASLRTSQLKLCWPGVKVWIGLTQVQDDIRVEHSYFWLLENFVNLEFMGTKTPTSPKLVGFVSVSCDL